MAYVTVLRPVHASSETLPTYRAGDAVEASPQIAARTRASTSRAGDVVEARPLIAARHRASTAYVTVLRLMHASSET